MKKLIIIVLILGAIGVGGYYGFEWYKGKQEVKIAKLEDKIHFLKEQTVPLKFKILEKDDTNIKFIVKFLDQDGTEFNLDTFELTGQELSFDFYMVPVKDSLKNDLQIAFPYKIFTNKIAAKDGQLLFDLYDDEGFPQIFDADGIDDDFVNLMTELFAKIKAGDTEDIKGIYGSMVQDVQNLNEFAEGHAYEIIIHTKGGIEIMEIQ